VKELQRPRDNIKIILKMTGSDFANWIELILVRIYMYTLL